MERKKFQEIALSGALLLSLGAMAVASHNSPKNPKNIECKTAGLVEPPPLIPSPEFMAKFLKVDKLQIVYGAGGRVVCNNTISLGNLADGIALKVRGVEEECIATLQYPHTKSYKDHQGTDVFDAFCPAPVDALPSDQTISA